MSDHICSMSLTVAGKLGCKCTQLPLGTINMLQLSFGRPYILATAIPQTSMGRDASVAIWAGT
jgi:hypothetical protein